MKDIEGGITAPHGFKSSGISSGLKDSGKKDLALIYTEKPADISAVFTTNQVQAAPVKLSKERISNGGPVKAIIINSGNANACTGKEGLVNARRMAVVTARSLDIEPGEVMIASTGIIGKRLPIEKIENALPEAVAELSSEDNHAAEAILTTDTCCKEKALKFRLPLRDREVRIGGMAKGSGMIHPRMATMLAFITTDLAISSKLLKKALAEAVDVSFNKISVDGDQSTNDTVFLLANGKAGGRKITECDRDFTVFVKALKKISQSLAKKIVADGEGATKFITINVKGAQSEEGAEEVARKIANSSLVKTACFGSDPNWGRILAAAGASNVEIKEDTIQVAINGQILFDKGLPVSRSSSKLEGLMDGENIEIDINLNNGDKSTVFWTTDISYKYVEINAEYHT